MRVKSVPRHLPRRDSLQARMKSTGGKCLGAEYTCAFEKVEGRGGGMSGGAVNVKMVNFTNYEDIVRKVELVVHQQKHAASSQKCEQNSYACVSDKVEAVDLSMQTRSSRRNFAPPPALLPLEPPPPLRELSRGIDASATLNNNNIDLKDTYLYQIMTNPDLLQKIIREKHQIYTSTSTTTTPSPTITSSTTASRQKTSNCPYCKREFGNEAEVKRHLNNQARNDSNQLLCCACGKSFAQKRYLRYHQRCHSERNKYACDICTRKYSRQDNLTRHNIFHTNPDKFPCNSCERTFARKDLLNKHLKCHENKWKYFCQACQKYFKGPVSLDNHMRLLHSDGAGGAGADFKVRRGACGMRRLRSQGNQDADCASGSSEGGSSSGGLDGSVEEARIRLRNN